MPLTICWTSFLLSSLADGESSVGVGSCALAPYVCGGGNGEWTGLAGAG